MAGRKSLVTGALEANNGRWRQIPPSPMNILIVDDHPMIAEYLSGAAAKAFEGALVCAVDDLDGALIALKAENARLVDDVPRSGAHGTSIAFVHPSSTGGVLVELVARERGPRAVR